MKYILCFNVIFFISCYHSEKYRVTTSIMAKYANRKIRYTDTLICERYDTSLDSVASLYKQWCWDTVNSTDTLYFRIVILNHSDKVKTITAICNAGDFSPSSPVTIQAGKVGIIYTRFDNGKRYNIARTTFLTDGDKVLAVIKYFGYIKQ
jgi:hypothetical protein